MYLNYEMPPLKPYTTQNHLFHSLCPKLKPCFSAVPVWYRFFSTEKKKPVTDMYMSLFWINC